MKDGFNRKIDYLRLSVTDRCNLRCIYCMPEKGIDYLEHEKILTYEEIIRAVNIFVMLGITKLKITGGEPLVRKNLKYLVKNLRKISKLESITLTTNGVLTEKLLEIEPYLDGINISLDTLKQNRYREITRGGDIKDVLNSIDALLKRNANLKLNVVPIKGFNDDEILDFANILKTKDIKIRFIAMMPLGQGKNFEPLNSNFIYDALKPLGEKIELNYKSNGPAEYFTYPGLRGYLGIINSLDHHFCKDCNRLRLSSKGFLQTCLSFYKGVDLFYALRNKESDSTIINLIDNAIKIKPKQNIFGVEDTNLKDMNEIGG